MERIKAQLRMVTGLRGRRVVERWCRAYPRLSEAGVRAPADVPAWVSRLDRVDHGGAEDVVRFLVAAAQDGDELAALTVLAILEPGLRGLSSRMGLPLDDVVGEASFVLLRFPVTRRRSVLAGLLLDVRWRLWYPHSRRALEALVEPEALSEMALPDVGTAERSTADEVVEVVCGAWQEGIVDPDDARLIIETRVGGATLAIAAARRGIPVGSASARRWRAEGCLTHALAA